ncbi:hypothetical protein ONZ45_g1235 [Pleurotus djamor]|nr:hypothetical protein ONZ45_g1235 [Pleurotus djamor]
MSSNDLPGADTYVVDDRDPRIHYSAGWSDEGVDEEFNSTTRFATTAEGLRYTVAPLQPPLDVERNVPSNGRLDTRSSPPTAEVTSELITRNQPPTDPPSALNMKGSQHPVHALTIPSSPMQTSASAQPSSRAVTTRYLKNSVGVDVDVNEPPPAYSIDGLGPNGPPNSSYVLDGTNPVRFSGPRTGGILYQQLFYQSPTLPNLEHTLQVTVLDEGSRYFLDFLAVRSPPQPTITSSSTSTTPSATESSPAGSDSAGSSSGSSTNVGAIVGGVVGGVAFLLLLAGLLWWFRRKRSTSTDPRGDMDYAGPQTTFTQSHLRSNSTSNYPPDAAASVSVFTPLTDNEMHHARPQPFLESRQSFDTSSLSTSYNNLGAPSVLGASSLQTQVQPFSALASTPVAGSTTGSGYGSKGAVHLTHTPTQQQHQSNPSYARSDSAAGEDQPPPAYGG